MIGGKILSVVFSLCLILLSCSGFKNAKPTTIYRRLQLKNPAIDGLGATARTSGSSLINILAIGKPVINLLGLLSSLVNPAVGGGILSGGLHAITGKHHQLRFHR